jgi:hypothetical protein
MKFLLVMIVSMALAGCLKTYPKINPAQPVEHIVTVRADRAWQDSHVHVRAGQVIKCKAEGQWSDHFNAYGPEGNPDIYKNHFGTNAPANSLIMKISSQTNTTYFIGKQASIVAERSGEIRFRKNYSLPIGMEGKIRVKVKVCADADGDGISDYDEIKLWKTNPLSPDSDGDGFTDLEEITDRQEKKGDSQ